MGKLYTFLRGTARVLLPKMQAEWAVPFDGQPSVFCPNHAGAFGPIDMCAFFPLSDRCHPWLNAAVMDPKLVPAYVRQDYWWRPGCRLEPLYNATLPYLAAAVWLTWGRPTGLRPWLLTGVGLCLIMLGTGDLLHIVLGWNSLGADLVLYVGLMALGFWLPTRMAGPFRGLRWRLPALLAAVLVGAMVWFTFRPPQGALFADLSQSQTFQSKER